MDNVGYLSLSRAAMIERANDIATNNLANANTDGFRAARPVFEELVTNSRRDGDMEPMSYAIDRGTYNDTSQGGVVATGNPLDIAIQGDAWLSYRMSDGSVGVGRDGRFVQSQNGELQTVGGNPVLDAGGAPIIIPPGLGDVSISSDGTITTPQGDVLGQIGIFEADAATWQRKPGGMLAVPEDQGPLAPAVDAKVLQGFTEGSNVNPILEMTRMISLQRAYERSMTAATGADELRKNTLERLGRS